jgi:hypothetical protein
MLVSTRGIRSIVFAVTTVAALAGSSASAQSAQEVRAPDARLTVAAVAGLYQMLDPRGYADGLAAAAYLRLLPDGRSRTEGVIVTDANGAITARTQVGEYHRLPWAIRQTAAGPELCFSVGGKTQCAQVERDPATSDLLLYDTARPRGHADLRLHRVGSAIAPARSE